MDNNNFGNNNLNNDNLNNNNLNNNNLNNNNLNNNKLNNNNTNTNKYSGYNPYQQSTMPNQGNAPVFINSPVPPKAAPKKKGGTGAFIGKVVAAALIFGLVSGSIFTGISYAGSKLTDTKKTEIGTTDKNSGKKTELGGNDKNIDKTASGDAADLTDVSGIVKEVMPSIVSITNTATVSYQDFWGRNENRQSQSCGSGFIISKNEDYLYIASNNHVVASADTLKVQFSDGKTVDAKVRGTDPSDDLAVVMVALKDMESDTLDTIKIATIGDSDSVAVGSASIAIGNALGYGQSVTTGVISALNRSVSTQDEQTGEVVTNSNLIQTDAAINPGNSGGALLNAKGEVIGINSVKYASTEVEGIGYAIPMAYAKPILESLINNGEYVDTQTAYLGIQGGDVSEEMAGYNIPQGVYVSDVLKGSGAEKAGIQQGDIITEFDGQKITGMQELQSLLKKHEAGDKVTIKVARQQGSGYEEKKIEITLSSKGDIKD